MKKKEIKIKCKGTNYVPIDSLLALQGNLKELKEADYKKLRKSIEDRGFRVPIFVWENWILDGHQRMFTIKKMLTDGWTIGPVPVVEIEAKDKKEAMELLLLISSRYGEVTEDGFAEFLSLGEIDLEKIMDEIKLPEIDEDTFKIEDLPEREEGLSPYKRTHILLSFPPDLLPKISKQIEELLKYPEIEYEQSSN
jgi:hypothetical protein